MKVSNLIQNIGKCRDALETKDFKTVLSKISLFNKVCDEAKVQVSRFIERDNYELDFTYSDLQELADETYAFIKNYQSRFTFDASFKNLIKIKFINNEVVRKFTQELCDLMYVDARLREAYKILAYQAITLWLHTEAKEQEGLDWQVTQAIRSFL